MLTHTPVLLREVMEILQPKAGEKFLDCTLGLGGHARELQKVIGTRGRIIALDADEENIKLAKTSLAALPQPLMLHANFRELPDCLPKDEREFDVIFADLGLSSPHVDDPKRGFTFRQDAPLDMRYDRAAGVSAAEFLETATERDLIDIFRRYGELPSPHRLAFAIVAGRKARGIHSSKDLLEIIAAVYGYRAAKLGAQVFQSVRMAVNDEEASLQALLATAPEMLTLGGRLAVISYHSLEDRLVKRAFRALTTPQKDDLTGAIVREAPFTLLTRHAIKPSEAEIGKNPRSRSARLRVLQRRK